VAATAARVRTLTAAPVVGVWTKRDARDDGVARGAPPDGTMPPSRPSDVTDSTPAASPASAASTDPSEAPDAGRPLVEVSAETGRGLRELVDAVQRVLGARLPAPADVPLVTRARHQRALAEARDEMAAFLDAWREGALPAPVAAVHVRAAVGALDDLIGAVDVEEVLGRVFATFCVGK
jgi:tRNA modification GTPase